MTQGAPEGRPVPEIPAPGRRIPLLIDTDAGCEIDDQYAIALAIHSPDRFDIQGFAAHHFHDDPDSIDRCAEEIERVLDLSGMSGRWPVTKGGPPLQWRSVPNDCEATDFIVERAMAHTPEDPMWIVILGGTTNTVSAYLKEPRIAERVRVLFHGRTQFWPLKAWNNNVDIDLRATQVLFKSDLPLVLFDTGTYLRVSKEETEARLAPRGRIGAYLHEIRMANPYRQSMKKGFFDLGDVAFLCDPALGEYEEMDIPAIGMDCMLQWGTTYGRGIRVYDIDRKGTWELLFRTLQEGTG